MLPSYFNCYLDVLNVNTLRGYKLRPNARPKSNCLEQDSYLPIMFTISVIKLINCTHINIPDIYFFNMKIHTLILDSTSMSKGSPYSNECTMPNCFQCGHYRYSGIIMIVLKLKPCRSEIILFVILKS